MIPPTTETIAWADGSWLNPPPEAVVGADLVVTAAQSSDFWRTTSYGFVHDDGHALLRPFASDTAVEVTFHLDYGRQFDQAGVLVRADGHHWVKAGVEVVDGAPQLGDALTVRARRAGEDWQFVRLAPWPPGLDAWAGPFCCAPTRAGLRVRFSGWRVGPADERLHE
jgi:hypothetical protein